VHGWLNQSRPVVYVLTDGSGHGDSSRLASSDALVQRAGASRGSVFGIFTDAQGYEAILRGDVALFRDVAASLASDWIERGITQVAGDSIEGYNPMHDMCRVIIDTAVAMARADGATIDNYDFAVVGRWAEDAQLVVDLDEDAFKAKLDAVRRYEPMRAESDAAIAQHGVEAFRSERFRLRDATLIETYDGKPFYETHGERQVAAGLYREVLRYREHVAPLVAALRTEVASTACAR
jgi:hypothetical protein